MNELEVYLKEVRNTEEKEQSNIKSRPEMFEEKKISDSPLYLSNSLFKTSPDGTVGTHAHTESENL